MMVVVVKVLALVAQRLAVVVVARDGHGRGGDDRHLSPCLLLLLLGGC